MSDAVLPSYNLSGFFAYAALGAAAPIGDVPAGPGVNIGGFAGCDAGHEFITGGQFGVGVGIAGGSGIFGVSNTFFIQAFSGWSAIAANLMFDTLNASPLSVLAYGADIAQWLAQFLAPLIPINVA